MNHQHQGHLMSGATSTPRAQTPREVCALSVSAAGRTRTSPTSPSACWDPTGSPKRGSSVPETCHFSLDRTSLRGPFRCHFTSAGDPHPIGLPSATSCPSWRTSIINELAEPSWQRASRSPRSSRPPKSGTRTATQGHPARLLPRTATTNDVDVRTMTSAMNRAGRVPVAATLAMVAAASMSTAARRLPSSPSTEPPM